MAVFPNGQGAYVGVAQQASWGSSTVNTGLKTFPNLSGDVLAGQLGKAARRSISTAMPSILQTYKTMSMTPVTLSFEFVADDTAYKPLMVAAWGKRVVSLISGADYKDTYTVNNPIVDGGTDGAPTFYNHSLSFHAFLSDGSTAVSGIPKFVAKDVVFTQFEMAGEANGAITMAFQGIGTSVAASSSTVVYTDQAGKIASWNDAINATPKGIFLDGNNPPTTGCVIRSFRFTLSNPQDFHPRLGAASGSEISPPFRNGPTTARLSVVMDFTDETSGTDALQIMTDFIAGTNKNTQISYYPDIDNFIQLNAFGATAPGALNNPRINWGGNGGPVGFQFDMDIYPASVADLSLVMATASNT